MFFYNFNNLDSFIQNDLLENIKQEENRLDKIINIYNAKKDSLSKVISDKISKINDIEDKKIETFKENISKLKSSFEELENNIKLAENLRKDLEVVTSLYNKNLNDNYNQIKAFFIEYNKKSEELLNDIFNFEANTIYLLELIPNNSLDNYNKLGDICNIKHNSIKSTSDNNVLLISEKEQKVYLPYKFSDLEEIYEKHRNKYFNVNSVISDLYILPLYNFKYSSISRFRETFNLMQKKEKQSILNSLNLALELMFKYELNPIIIAACKNLDELDIYLDCLDENEVDKFNCFEIKFEISPELHKNNKDFKTDYI